MLHRNMTWAFLWSELFDFGPYLLYNKSIIEEMRRKIWDTLSGTKKLNAPTEMRSKRCSWHDSRKL